MRERHDIKDEITHACPASGSGLTGCCNLPPFELPAHHRLSIDPKAVNCRGKVKVAPDWVWIPPAPVNDDTDWWSGYYHTQDTEAADINPRPAPSTIIDPDDLVKGSIQIPVDKSRYRIRYINETEHYVDVVVEPKPKQ